MARKSTKTKVPDKMEFIYELSISEKDCPHIYYYGTNNRESFMDGMKYVKGYIDRNLYWKIKDGANGFSEELTTPNYEDYLNGKKHFSNTEEFLTLF